jgi:hypothetical protein
LEKLSEEFLDTVFDTSSKLERKVFMDTVALKANWIFSSKLLREKIE